MWFGVVTLFPEMFDLSERGGLMGGVIGRAVESGLIEVELFNPRDFTSDRHRTVDDRPYGGGPGMVMMVEPLTQAVHQARNKAPADTRVVLMSPQGEVFRQSTAVSVGAQGGVILVCGRYEGLDERFIRSEVDAEWSVGDFVVSGGELPALMVIDAVARHVPGVLGNRQSIFDESHLDGTLDYPHYTRPENTGDSGGQVPDILLSGNHPEITAHRRREALWRTFQRRPEMLTRRLFSSADRKLLMQCFEQEAEDAKKQDN